MKYYKTKGLDVYLLDYCVNYIDIGNYHPEDVKEDVYNLSFLYVQCIDLSANEISILLNHFKL